MKTLAHLAATAVFSAAIAATLTATPANAQGVMVDYDHTINFLKFKSYTLQKLHATDPGVETRLTIALDRDLQARYLHPEDKNPDIIVTVVESDEDKEEYPKFYDSLSGMNWQRGWATTSGFLDSEATLQDIPSGTLVLDMWDGKTKKLIWRGTLTEPASVTSAKEADQKMDKAIGQLLAQFPPKFKK